MALHDRAKAVPRVEPLAYGNWYVHTIRNLLQRFDVKRVNRFLKEENVELLHPLADADDGVGGQFRAHVQ